MPQRILDDRKAQHQGGSFQVEGGYAMEHFRQRSCLTLIGAIVWIILTTIAAVEMRAAEMPKELIIGYQVVPNPETVVKELGWNEKELGIPVKWIHLDSGRHVTKALAEGSVDIGLVGTSPTAAAISQGIPIEVIWIHDVIGDSERLVVREDSGIDRMVDLVGKKVAAPFGSTTHYHLMVALKLANVKADAVNIVNLEPGQMPNAWERGDIDGGFVWEPTLSKMLEKGGKVLLSSRELAERGFPTADLCVVRKDFATKYPSVVIKYLKILDKAVRFIRSKPQEAAAAIARQFDISPEDAARQMKGLILLTGEEQISGKYVGNMQLHFGLYTLLKETADFLMNAKELESSPPWPVFMRAVNSAYVLEALAEYKRDVLRPRSFN
ncbi:MAG: ABC transporter substrate-binding protein [Desulfobacterales bacterium]|jgi:taurine transport system substrate-binding protein